LLHAIALQGKASTLPSFRIAVVCNHVRCDDGGRTGCGDRRVISNTCTIGAGARRKVSRRRWQDADATEARWTAASLVDRPIRPEHRRTWQRFNRLAGGQAPATK